jgi:hypothetical protein
MTKKTFWFVLLLLSIALSACSTFPIPRPAADFSSVQCIPSFPDQDGWYGGDGAYSVKLDNQHTLWVFGDTFVADDMGRKDRIGGFLHWTDACVTLKNLTLYICVYIH